MDPVKLMAINDWAPPHSVSEVRSFMGFYNFYRKFIPDFSKIVQPLLSLTKKNMAWQWLSDYASSFVTLKEAFLKRPVLRYPDTDLPFFVMTDTSLVASGVVLMQKDGNRDLHPCAYYSKTFALANYDLYDRKLLAIIRSLKEWCQYLTGMKHPVTIITDHQNLTYFKSPQNLSQQQARWHMFMQDYDLVWDNRPGSQMGLANVLSCCNEVDTLLDILLDNTAITMLPTVSDVLICALDVRLVEKIAKFTATNPLVQDTWNAMSKHTSLFPYASFNNWTFIKGSLYFKGHLYVPEPAQQDLVRSLHDSLAGGHGRYFCTVHLVQHDYWWPGLTTFVC